MRHRREATARVFSDTIVSRAGGFGSYAGLGSTLVGSSIARAGELLESEGTFQLSCTEMKFLLAQ